jgi:hypothetical protein
MYKNMAQAKKVADIKSVVDPKIMRMARSLRLVKY